MSNLALLLETARRAEGLTQAELAELAGVTQAALSRYESGLREPDAETLTQIAGALNLTPIFFHDAIKVRGATAVEAHMRRRRTARPSQWRRLEARLNMHRLHARRVFDEVALRTEHRVPTFDPIEGDAATAASMLRMQWHMPSGPVRNLVGWAEQAGCLVIEEDFGTPGVDGLSQWIDDVPVVLLNAAAPTDRKRLTLGHEIGHLCLHADEVGDEPETQANTFAAELLMPASTIKIQLRDLKIAKLLDLKREWQVSMQALVERAHDLKVITPARRTSLWKALSAKGWRTSEPLSDELAPERPTLTHQIGSALASRGLGGPDVAELLGYARTCSHHPYAPTPRLRAL